MNNNIHPRQITTYLNIIVAIKVMNVEVCSNLGH
jgi:hypothetical protein